MDSVAAFVRVNPASYQTFLAVLRRQPALRGLAGEMELEGSKVLPQRDPGPPLTLPTAANAVATSRAGKRPAAAVQSPLAKKPRKGGSEGVHLTSRQSSYKEDMYHIMVSLGGKELNTLVPREASWHDNMVMVSHKPMGIYMGSLRYTLVHDFCFF